MVIETSQGPQHIKEIWLGSYSNHFYYLVWPVSTKAVRPEEWRDAASSEGKSDTTICLKHLFAPILLFQKQG